MKSRGLHLHQVLLLDVVTLDRPMHLKPLAHPGTETGFVPIADSLRIPITHRYTAALDTAKEERETDDDQCYPHLC